MDGGFAVATPSEKQPSGGLGPQSCLFASPPRGDFALSRMKGVAIRAGYLDLLPKAATKTGGLVCYSTLVRIAPPGKSRITRKPMPQGNFSAPAGEIRRRVRAKRPRSLRWP